MLTPWGESQQETKLADGIVSYSTAGHGGIHVDQGHNLLIHKAWRIDDGWYEEDCEWAKVAFQFPAYFTAKQVASAVETLKGYFYREYEIVTGDKVDISESSVMRQDIWNKEHENHLQVISAYGTWCQGVPVGMVGVVTVLGSKLDYKTHTHNKSDERYFLVPESEYTIPFAIEDPAKYQEVKEFDSGEK